AAATAAPATLLVHLQFDILVQRLGALQLLQRAELRRDRVTRSATAQRLHGRAREGRGGVERPRDLLERAVDGRRAALDELTRQPGDLVAMLRLLHGDGGKVLAELRRGTRRAVAEDIERGDRQ